MTTPTNTPSAADLLRVAALDYHRHPSPGKIAVTPTKPMATQRDLALAYSPGVAEACLEIVRDPLQAGSLTSRANLVAVVTNGTAVLGLGDIGPLAGKPVMEGKGCLFKKFAGIDVFDIELDEADPDAIVDTIARMEPTFGGINLEDIKAPECFYIEKKLRERMKIPVFHDDQHGTAIVAAAFLLNALQYLKKDIASIRVVTSGAGAAALACLDLMVGLGVKREHITACDGKGVIYNGRASVDGNKARYSQDTAHRTLADAIVGADVFLGLSVAGVLKPGMVATMANNPIILAMANPSPEILPEDALSVRPDAIIGTGRSDYPNQVNNVLCFPFIFRGALDVGATTINEEMKVASVRAIAALAQAEIPEVVARAYGGSNLRFGPGYLIPKPFDPRLIETVAPAVAEAAMASGVATRPIADLRAYRERLAQANYHSGSAMQPVFAAAKRNARRVAYAEGEDERVLRAAQVAVDEGIARPMLIGRAAVILERIAAFGLRMRPGLDFDLANLSDDESWVPVMERYKSLDGRQAPVPLVWSATGVAIGTLIGAMLLRTGQVDALLCGTVGAYADHLVHVRHAIGMRAGVRTLAAMQMLILPGRQIFIADTHVNADPSAEQISEIACLAAEAVSSFGVTPNVALLSHSSFGSSNAPQAQKMRDALLLAQARAPHLQISGEMQGDAALAPETVPLPDGLSLNAPANLLVMPNIDAANISYNLLRVAAGNGVTVGGILLGAAQPVHILTTASTVRRIVNMTALATAQAAASQT